MGYACQCLTIEHMCYYNYSHYGGTIMAKLIGEPIKVHLDKDSIPDAFIWRKRVYRVTEVVNWWREPAE